jgi:hypothetical protein
MDGLHRLVAAAPRDVGVGSMTQEWPAWRRSPSGERRVFARPEDVPEGWMNPADWRPPAEAPAQPAPAPAPAPVKRGPGRPRKAAP